MYKYILTLGLTLNCFIVYGFDCGSPNLNVSVDECQALNSMYDTLGIADSTLSDDIKAAWGGRSNVNVCDTNEGSRGITCIENCVVAIKLIGVDLQGEYLCF